MNPPSFATALTAWVGFWLSAVHLFAAAPLIPAGAARVDVTPTRPVVLMGYAARASMGPASNSLQRLHARAIALGEGDQAAVVVAIDQCILPGSVTAELRRRLADRAGLREAQVAFTVTHTHAAPCLSGAAPNILGRTFTTAEQEGIDAYTRFFVERVEQVVVEALKNRSPALVSWGQGRVGFARNRRTPGGPVDHDLPVLRVAAPDGTLRAVLANYACHCTTLGGENNASHGDWAGVAALDLEASTPGAVALVSIGCGADANPEPRGSVQLAEQHGRALASEVRRLINLPLEPLASAPETTLESIALPFRRHFTREEWEKRAATPGIVGHHARRWLERLDRGESPGPTLPYPVQTWSFSTNLAMVFLGGEVVVDYALRLKGELDGRRLWVTAYANDVPGYIPSRRILAEGGYEADTSLWYYDRPQQFAPALEDLVVDAVRRPLLPRFEPAPTKGEMTPPREARRALESFSHPPSLVVELVAGDDLVQSPVAIDFGADGRLWVAEMSDYPAGDQGGRIKVLEDADQDGVLDRARVVAQGLPFPTGLMAWKDGVLVCAAPDVWWISSDGSQRQRLLAGFATHNFQARVNGLRWGLDGWVHGAGGLFGGKIRSLQTGLETDATGRDFRFQPDAGAFETLVGVSQQGRPRDDFGQWFGNDNGSLLWSFPMPPAAAALGFEPPRASLPANRDGNRVFPTSQTLERFNDPHTANHLTSACGPEIFRGSGLGPGFEGDAFVCEPVHNLVRRAHLAPDGVGFAATRDASEKASEFLSSTDHWFRPVEARTGTDGCLWVVDMQRFVIEHPRWIAPDRLARLDVRAGADRGRIYRIRAANRPAIPLPKLHPPGGPAALSGFLASREGPLRDLAQREIQLLPPPQRAGIVPDLSRLLEHPSPAVRAQTLWTLHNIDALPAHALNLACNDPDERTRLAALDLAFVRSHPIPEPTPASLLSTPALRFRTALALARAGEPGAARIAAMVLDDPADAWLASVALGAARSHGEAFARRLATAPSALVRLGPALDRWLQAWAASNPGALAAIAPALMDAARADVGVAFPWLAALTGGEPDRSRWPVAARPLLDAWEPALAARATHVLRDPSRPEPQRIAAASLAAARASKDASLDADAIQALDDLPPGPVLDSWVRALSAIERPALAARCIQGLDTASPRARQARLAVLLARRTSARALAEAVRTGGVATDAWTLEQRQSLKERAGGSPVSSSTPDRADVIQRYATASAMTGDRRAGSAHFERLCSSCHAMAGRGHAVGPDLGIYRGKPLADFLLAVLDPNAAVDGRHRTRRVELKDGRELVGVANEEGRTGFVLAQPGGIRERIERSNVARMEDVAASLMPEGFEEALTPQAMADLAAWVREAPRSFGMASPEQARANRERWAQQAPSGTGNFHCVEPMIPYASWLGRLPLRVCRQDTGTNRLEWVSRPAPGTTTHRWPVAMGFHSQPKGHFVLRIEDVDEVEFDVALDDTQWTTESGAGRLRYRVEERNNEDSNGVMELDLAPANAARPLRISVTGTPTGSLRWFGVYEDGRP